MEEKLILVLKSNYSMQCSNFAILEIVYFARISISPFCKAFAEAKTKRISVVKIQGIKKQKNKKTIIHLVRRRRRKEMQ